MARILIRNLLQNARFTPSPTSYVEEENDGKAIGDIVSTVGSFFEERARRNALRKKARAAKESSYRAGALANIGRADNFYNQAVDKLRKEKLHADKLKRLKAEKELKNSKTPVNPDYLKPGYYEGEDGEPGIHVQPTTVVRATSIYPFRPISRLDYLINVGSINSLYSILENRSEEGSGISNEEKKNTYINIGDKATYNEVFNKLYSKLSLSERKEYNYINNIYKEEVRNNVTKLTLNSINKTFQEVNALKRSFISAYNNANYSNKYEVAKEFSQALSKIDGMSGLMSEVFEVPEEDKDTVDNFYQSLTNSLLGAGGDSVSNILKVFAETSSVDYSSSLVNDLTEISHKHNDQNVLNFNNTDEYKKDVRKEIRDFSSLLSSSISESLEPFKKNLGGRQKDNLYGSDGIVEKGIGAVHDNAVLEATKDAFQEIYRDDPVEGIIFINEVRQHLKTSSGKAEFDRIHGNITDRYKRLEGELLNYVGGNYKGTLQGLTQLYTISQELGLGEVEAKDILKKDLSSVRGFYRKNIPIPNETLQRIQPLLGNNFEESDKLVIGARLRGNRRHLTIKEITDSSRTGNYFADFKTIERRDPSLSYGRYFNILLKHQNNIPLNSSKLTKAQKEKSVFIDAISALADGGTTDAKLAVLVAMASDPRNLSPVEGGSNSNVDLSDLEDAIESTYLLFPYEKNAILKTVQKLSHNPTFIEKIGELFEDIVETSTATFERGIKIDANRHNESFFSTIGEKFQNLWLDYSSFLGTDLRGLYSTRYMARELKLNKKKVINKLAFFDGEDKRFNDFFNKFLPGNAVGHVVNDFSNYDVSIVMRNDNINFLYSDGGIINTFLEKPQQLYLKTEKGVRPFMIDSNKMIRVFKSKNFSKFQIIKYIQAFSRGKETQYLDSLIR